MRAIRWLLLVLYFALIIGLGILAFRPDNNTGLVIVFSVAVISLITFIGGTASKDLWRPIRRPRLILPVISAAFMLAFLTTSLTAALDELLMANAFPAATWAGWAILAANWAFWSVLLFVYTRNLNRFGVIYQLAKLVFAGSLAELIATIPSHIIVTRRGTCFAGIGTGISLLAGLGVMMWSFGPGILMLFFRHVTVDQAASKASRLSTVAPHREQLQFGIRAVLLVTFAVSVIAGLSRTLWGKPFGIALAALLLFYLLSMLLMRQSTLRILVGLVVLVGSFYIFWGKWTMLAFILLPGSVLLLVFLYFYAPQSPFGAEGNEP